MTFRLSPAKFTANIANAQKSTGPRTEEGKATAARNSFKHGLASANLHVPEHLQPLYDEITEDLSESIRPDGTLEDDAFSQLRNARFMMERVLILQSELGHQFEKRGSDPLTDPNFQKQFQTLQKYYQTAQSNFRANLREIRTLQTERRIRAYFFQADKPVPGLANYRLIFQIRQKVMRIRDNGAKALGNAFANSPLQGDPQ